MVRLGRSYVLQSEKRMSRGGATRNFPLVVVCYPNTYEVGMANLAFHFLLRVFSKRRLRVERAFALPRGGRKRSLTFEAREPMERAASILTTFSFEEDYVNFLDLVRTSELPLLAEKRNDRYPLVFAGGGAVSANPTVMAPFCDAIALGEGDETVDFLADLIEAFAHGYLSRGETLEELSIHGNFFVPRIDGVEKAGVPVKLSRVNGYYEPVASEIVSPYSHFPDTVLIEINRSCASSCRFCLASHLYKPYRVAKREAIIDICKSWRGRAKSIGLLGTSVASYPGFESLCEEIRSMDFSLRISSLRIQGLKKSTLKLLDSFGTRTVTLAPESPNAVLRRVLRKNVDDMEIYDVLLSIASLRIRSAKLYFLLGIPGESDEDIVDIVSFIRDARKLFGRARKRLRYSVNFLIPKAWTPFQWHPLPARGEIDRRRMLFISTAKRELRETPVLPSSSSILYQAILSMGGEELKMGISSGEAGKGRAIHRWLEGGVDLDSLIHSEKERQHSFPWDFIDAGIDKDDLYREYLRSRDVLESAD